MADIGKWGGKAIVNAGSSPTGHTIHMTSNQSWLKVYQDNQSTAIASAGTNTNADDRSAIVSITATTVSDPSYQGTASVVCGWTVTQAGTGSTPAVPFSIYCENLSSYDIAFGIATANTYTAIVVSGHTTSNSSEYAISNTYLNITSSTYPMYLFVKSLLNAGPISIGFTQAPVTVQGAWMGSGLGLHALTESWTHVAGYESSAPVTGTNWFDDQGTGEMRVYVTNWF